MPKLSIFQKSLMAVAALLISSASVVAKADGNSIKASESRGSTCLHFLRDVVKPALDADFKQTRKVADRATIKSGMAAQFDPTVIQKDERVFKNGVDDLDQLVGAIEGTDFTPATLPGMLGKKLELLKNVDPSKIGLDGVVLAPLIGILSGAGVHIQWTEGAPNAVSVEYGYKPGEPVDTGSAVDQDVKSGRGFGMVGDRKLLDASDALYLKNLTSYLSKKDRSDFFQLIMDVLSRMDTARYKDLDQEGELVATDFFTVYVAEQVRHLMTGLKTHAWENDLAEATMISAYVTSSNKIFKNGKLDQGSPSDFYALGKSGSGIGETRADRRSLQRAVTTAMKTLHPDLVKAITDIIGDSSDVFQDVMGYLNNPQKEKDVVADADALSKAVTDFLSQVSGSAEDITKHIQSAP